MKLFYQLIILLVETKVASHFSVISDLISFRKFQGNFNFSFQTCITKV